MLQSAGGWPGICWVCSHTPATNQLLLGFRFQLEAVDRISLSLRSQKEVLLAAGLENCCKVRGCSFVVVDVLFSF